MRCTTPGDAYLLLKSSDFVSHDLSYPFDGCVDAAAPGESGAAGYGDGDGDGGAPRALPAVSYTLVLRKWSNLYPQAQYRCFVKGLRLVGISQRQCSAFYPSLAADSDRTRDTIFRFHRDKVRGRYLGGPDYVMDVYVDKKWRVWIIDFNAYGEGTDSLLFSWTEPLLGKDSAAEAGSASAASGGDGDGSGGGGGGGGGGDATAADDAAAAAAAAAAADAGEPPLDADEERFIAEALALGGDGEGGGGDEDEEARLISEALDGGVNISWWSASDVVVRLVDDESLRSDPLAVYRAPLDMHGIVSNDGAGEGEAWTSAVEFKRFMEKCEKGGAGGGNAT